VALRNIVGTGIANRLTKEEEDACQACQTQWIPNCLTKRKSQKSAPKLYTIYYT